MADIENFEADSQNAEDPAAAFLAREQTELAGLEDDNFVVMNNNQPPEDEFDPFGEESGAQAEPNQDVSGQQPNGPSDLYSAIASHDRHRQEPEKIKVWREEQKKRLEKKDEEEETRKIQWNEAAKKEMDDWYKHHEEQLVKTKQNNRDAENSFVKERDETMPGHEWEKICRLCEFNPKHTKMTKDVSRLRSILLQLKQMPLVR